LDAVVLKQHQERLDERARAVMSGADAHVNEGTAQFQTMPRLARFTPGAVYDPAGQDTGDTSTSGHSTGSTHWPVEPRFNPPPPSVPSSDNTGTTPVDTAGPVLASAPTPTTSAP